MNHSASYVLAVALYGAGLFRDPAVGGALWPLYIGDMPDSPDKSAVVMDTAAKQDGRMMNTGESITHQGVQLVLRSSSHEEGAAKAAALAAWADGLYGEAVTIDATVYTIQNASRRGSPIFVGQDEGDHARWLWSLNLTMTIRT